MIHEPKKSKFGQLDTKAKAKKSLSSLLPNPSTRGGGDNTN